MGGPADCSRARRHLTGLVTQQHSGLQPSLSPPSLRPAVLEFGLYQVITGDSIFGCRCECEKQTGPLLSPTGSMSEEESPIEDMPETASPGRTC